MAELESDVLVGESGRLPTPPAPSPDARRLRAPSLDARRLRQSDPARAAAGRGTNAQRGPRQRAGFSRRAKTTVDAALTPGLDTQMATDISSLICLLPLPRLLPLSWATWPSGSLRALARCGGGEVLERDFFGSILDTGMF